MSDLDTFIQLPITIDPQSKAVQAAPSSSSSSAPSKSLTDELAALNALHRSLLTLEHTPQVPPPPVPFPPKRSAAVARLRDSGNAEFKKGKLDEAVRMYTLGIQMALGRPHWEPASLVREEVAALYSNRAQAHMSQGNWALGYVDAQTSVEARRMGNAKAWWRCGKCLMEMGRFDEALENLHKGLEYEGEEAELRALVKEVESRIEKAAAS